jgi:antitoxin component YwqK of YwqJK toxin-antitoxin module
MNEIKRYHTNGNLSCETPYENGNKHGIEKEYYEDGMLSSETPYENGNKHGIARKYDKDLVLYEEKLYQNNKLIRTLREIVLIRDLFVGYGDITIKTPYINGQKHGVSKGYYENKTLAFETPYINGRINGINKEYRKNGKNDILPDPEGLGIL